MGFHIGSIVHAVTNAVSNVVSSVVNITSSVANTAINSITGLLGIHIKPGIGSSGSTPSVPTVPPYIVPPPPPVISDPGPVDVNSSSYFRLLYFFSLYYDFFNLPVYINYHLTDTLTKQVKNKRYLIKYDTQETYSVGNDPKGFVFVNPDTGTIVSKCYSPIQSFGDILDGGYFLSRTIALLPKEHEEMMVFVNYYGYNILCPSCMWRKFYMYRPDSTIEHTPVQSKRLYVGGYATPYFFNDPNIPDEFENLEQTGYKITLYDPEAYFEFSQSFVYSNNTVGLTGFFDKVLVKKLSPLLGVDMGYEATVGDYNASKNFYYSGKNCEYFRFVDFLNQYEFYIENEFSFETFKNYIVNNPTGFRANLLETFSYVSTSSAYYIADNTPELFKFKLLDDLGVEITDYSFFTETNNKYCSVQTPFGMDFNFKYTVDYDFNFDKDSYALPDVILTKAFSAVNPYSTGAENSLQDHLAMNSTLSTYSELYNLAKSIVTTKSQTSTTTSTVINAYSLFILPSTFLNQFLFKKPDASNNVVFYASDFFGNKTFNHANKNIENYSLLNMPSILNFGGSDMSRYAGDEVNFTGAKFSFAKAKVWDFTEPVVATYDKYVFIIWPIKGFLSDVQYNVLSEDISAYIKNKLKPSILNSTTDVLYFPLAAKGVESAMNNAELSVRSYTKLKTNFLCITAEDVRNGDYTKAILGLNHVFAGSKNEGLFLLFDGNLYFGKSNDDLNKDETQKLYNYFLNIIKGGTVESGSNVVLLSSSFSFTNKDLILQMQTVVRNYSINNTSTNNYYVSNAINIFTFSDYYFNLIPEDVLNTVDACGFFVNSVNKFVFAPSVTQINENRKNLISLSYNSLISVDSSVAGNTAISYDDSKLSQFFKDINTEHGIVYNGRPTINPTKSLGRLFLRDGQTEVKYLNPAKTDGTGTFTPSFVIDLNPFLSSVINTTSLVVEPPAPSCVNLFDTKSLFAEILFNGRSSNLYINITSAGSTISVPSDVNSDFVFQNLGNNKLRVTFKPTSSRVSTPIPRNINKISFVLYHIYYGSYVKVYFEESHLNFVCDDVTPINANATLTEDLAVNFNLDDNVSVDLIDIYNVSESDSYSLVYKIDDNVVNGKTIPGAEYPLISNISTSNSSFSLRKNLKTLLNSGNKNAPFPDSFDLYSTYKIVLRRSTGLSYKDLFSVPGTTYPRPTRDNFDLTILQSTKLPGNLGDGSKGYAVLSVKDVPSLDYFYSSLADVEMLIDEAVVSRPFNFDFLSLLTNSLPTNYPNGDALIYKISYNASGVVPESSDTFTFNNDGETVTGRLSCVLSFNGVNNERLSFGPTEYAVGAKSPIQKAQYDLHSPTNARRLLDGNTPDALVFYNQNVDFDISFFDPIAEKYSIKQTANDTENFVNVSYSGQYSYYVDSQKITDYRYYPDIVNYDPNTDPLKMSFGKSFLTTSGVLRERISDDLEIPIIVRKRPSIPALTDNSAIYSKITVNNDNKIATKDLSQAITFETYSGIYSSGLIDSIEGFLYDPLKNTTFGIEYLCELKSDPGKYVTMFFSSYFSIRDNIQNSIKNNSKIIFDFSVCPVTLITNKATGNPVDYSSIKSFKRNGEILSTFNTNLFISDLIQDFVTANQSSLKAGTLSLNLNVRSCDVTFRPENISRLKALKNSKNVNVYDSNFISQLEKDCKSDYFSKKFNLVVGGNDGLYIAPVKNLFTHSDSSVVEAQTVPTYYTYADDVTLSMLSYNSQKLEYKVGESTSFIEALVSSVSQGDILSYVSTLNLSTPKNSEQVVVVRQYNSAGSVDSEIVVKVIRIDKALIAPKISYSSIQDDENNNKNYGKKEVCFSLEYTDYIDHFVATIKNQDGAVVLNSANISNSSEGYVISAPVIKYDSVYTLDLEAYDKSGRLVKIFKYKALYITQSVEVNLNVLNGVFKDTKYVVNGESVVLTFPNDSAKNIAGYKIDVNNGYTLYTAQNTSGDNEVEITHLSGKVLENGSYFLKVTPVNLLEHESDKTSSASVSFYRVPSHIDASIKTYENNVSNNLNCSITDYDKDNTDRFIYDVLYTALDGTSKKSSFECRDTTLTFVKNGVDLSNDIQSNTSVTINIHAANYNGYYDPKVVASYTFKYFNETVVVDSSYFDFISKTTDSNFVALIKKHPYVAKIECKIESSTSSYTDVTDCLFVSPSAFTSEGAYTFKTRFTDISGATFESDRTVYYSPNESTYEKALDDNIYVDTSAGRSEFVLNIGLDFKEFGHSQFLMKNRTVTNNVFTINNTSKGSAVQLTLEGYDLPTGMYVYDLYAHSSKTDTYSKFVKSIFVYYLKEKPVTPSVVTQFLVEESKNQAYTNTNEFMLTWNAPASVKYLKNIVLDIKISKDGSYVQFLEPIILDISTLFYKIPLKIDSVNNRYLITLKTLAVNNKYSDSFDLYLNQLVSKPKPPVFNLDPTVNSKYVKQSANNIYEFVFDDSANVNSYEKLSKVEVLLNNSSSYGVFPLVSGTNIAKNTDGTFTLKLPFTVSDSSNLDVFLIGYDKAGNSTINTVEAARNLSSYDFSDSNGKLKKQYSYFTKVIDGVKPVNLTSDTIVVKKNASTLVSAATSTSSAIYKDFYNSIDVMFDLPSNDTSYLAFEFYLNKYKDVAQSDGTVKATEVDGTLYCSGTTFNYQQNTKDINLSGIALNDNPDRFSILPVDDYSLISSSFENIKIHLPNLPSGNHGILITSIDLSGNVSDGYLVPVAIKNLPSLTPYFTSPLDSYVKNDSLSFEWDIDTDINIDRWEYQFVEGDVSFSNYDESWNSNATSRVLKKRVFGYDVNADNIYKLRVRGVTLDSDGKISETTVPVVKTVVLDVKTPGSIRFTQSEFTNTNSSLKFSWEKSNDDDDIAGVYLSFNSSLSMDKWIKVSNSVGEYVSHGQRTDGTYTIYAIPYDKAGNIYSGAPIIGSITIDTTPPKKITLQNNDLVIVNDIPTVSWVKNYNIKTVRWLLLSSEYHEDFISAYSSFKNLSDYDYRYIWDIDYNNEDGKVSQQVLDFVDRFPINKNISEDNLTSSSVKLYYQDGVKHGLGGPNSDGTYYFYIVGVENSGYYTSEASFLKIIYDTELVDTSSIKLIDFSSSTSERNPLFKIETPLEINNINVKILNASTNLEYVGKDVSMFVDSGNRRTFKYQTPISLPYGDYIVEVSLYDSAKNEYVFSKLFTVISSSNSTLQDVQDIFISELNCKATISKVRNTSSYVITYINLNPNSSLFYRVAGSTSGYSLYKIGVTPLDNEKNYEFEVLGYNIATN